MFVIDSLGIGGAERQLVALLTRINRSQYDPLVVCLSRKAEVLTEAASLRPLLLERHTKRDLLLIWRLAMVMRARKVELVQSYLWLANFYASTAARLAGVPIVVSSVRGIEYTTSSWKGRLRWVADRLLAHTRSAMVVNSKAMRQHLIERGFAAAKIRVIHNGVDNDNLLEAMDAGQAKEALGLSPTIPTVGICARLVPVKDHHTFLLAAKKVLEVLPQTKFILLGDGPLRESLERFANELGIRSSVIFTGMVSDGIGKALAALDVSVLCSKHESFPNAVLESMALGKPVVATAVGGCPELVLNGETGLLVPSQDAARLAEAVVRLLSDQGLAKRMGEQGQQRARQHFSIGRMVQGYEKLYTELLEEKHLLPPAL
jgi:glycosyltransferase involved in cell wall biosynthesis